MNTRETNEKNLKKMEALGTVFDDGENKSKIDEVTAELPFAFSRKMAAGASGIFWLVSIIFMFAGGDFRAILPFLLLSLSAVALLNVPKFLALKKTFDVIVSSMIGIFLLLLSISLLILD